MTLLAVERIKLFSTRSPWWCSITALVLSIGFTALMALSSGGGADGMTLAGTLVGQRFALVVVLALAALTITTEYRFGTIRSTFQAVPGRASVLFAKAGVTGLLALVIGEAAALGSWAAARSLAPGPGLAIAGGDAWRQLLGAGPFFAFAAVLAIGVGALLRHTAGAVTALMLWSLLAENLIGVIPDFGPAVQDWLPFTAGQRFTAPADPSAALGPWASLAYFAVVSVAVLVVAAVVIRRRDA